MTPGGRPRRAPRDGLARAGILFDGADLRAYDCTFGARGGTVVVTFPIARADQSLDRLGFLERFLAREGLPAIVFTASWNHWMQTPETDAALAAIAPVLARFDRVVSCGASMGGFAACATSRALGADAILVSAPRFSVDPAKAPWDGKERAEIERIGRGAGFCRDDMASGIAPDAALFVLFDPRLPRDRRHAEALLALSRRPRPLPMPFAGHAVAGTVSAAGLFEALALSVVTGGPDPRIRERFRACRRLSVAWWVGVARAALPRRPRLAAHAARQALALPSAAPHLTEAAAGLLARAEAALGAPPPPKPAPEAEAGPPLLRRPFGWVSRRG